jgi:uncharacterized protein
MADQPRVHSFGVTVNGSKLPRNARADMISVAVYDDLDAPSMFTLRLVNWDDMTQRFTWSDNDLFAIGHEVEVQMGYVNQLGTLIVGEITGVEAAYEGGEVPTVTVRGYDLRHRLLRGRKTRSFVSTKDSEVADQIAAEAKLSIRAEDTGVTLDYLIQHNQTDMHYLQERARRIGYELAIEGKTLLFRPFQNATGSVLKLRLGRELLEFYPRLSSLSQVGGVTVRGWDPKAKTAIIAKASAGEEAGKMGPMGGPQESVSAFGPSDSSVVDQPVFSAAEAERDARGRLNSLALTYIDGEGVVIGNNALRAGKVVELEGLGRRFSGRYYLTSITHTWLRSRGYRTAFTTRRNAT